MRLQILASIKGIQSTLPNPRHGVFGGLSPTFPSFFSSNKVFLSSSFSRCSLKGKVCLHGHKIVEEKYVDLYMTMNTTK